MKQQNTETTGARRGPGTPVRAFQVFLLLLAALLFLLLPLFLPLRSAAAGTTVFVSAGQGDDGGPGSQAKPYKTLTAALKALKNGGTLVITDLYTVTEKDGAVSAFSQFTEPEHTGAVVYTSVYGGKDYRQSGAALRFSGDYVFSCGGPVTFSQITVQSNASLTVAGNFFPLRFGEGFSTANHAGNASKFLYAVGGYCEPQKRNLNASSDASLIIDAGYFKAVIGSTYRKGAATYTFTGTARVTVNGGQIDTLYGGSVLNHYAGGTEITVNGGTVTNLYAAGDQTRRLNGNAALYLYGGNVTNVNINNVLGDTSVLLNGSTVKTMKVSYGNSTIESLAFGKKISLSYNSCVYGKSWVDGLSGFTEKEAFGFVYLRAGATGGGLRREDPTGSLSEAYRLLAESGGTVVLLGEYEVKDFTEPTHAGNVLFTGEDGASLTLSEAFTLAGNTAFEKITLKGNAEISSSSFDLKIGRDTVTEGSLRISFIGKGSGKASTLTLSSGSFEKIAVRAEGTEETAPTVLLTGGEVGELSTAGGPVRIYLSGKTKAETLSLSSQTLLEMAGGEVAFLSVGGTLTLRLGGGTIGAASLSGGGKGSFSYTEEADSQTVAGLASLLGEGEKEEPVLFVSDGGEGEGFSSLAPAGSLKEAVDKLKNGGTVVICGPLSVEEETTFPAEERGFCLTSVWGGVDYRKSGATLSVFAGLRFLSDAKLCGLDLSVGADSLIFSFGGNKAEVGEDTVCELSPGATGYIGLVGGFPTSSRATESSLTVNGGRWQRVLGGNSVAFSRPTEAHFSVTVNGGEIFGPLIGGGVGGMKGSVSVTVMGGTLHGGIFGLSASENQSFDGTLTVTVNGGAVCGKITPATSRDVSLSGSYRVELTGGDFSRLTDIEGDGVYPKGDLTSEITVSEGVSLWEEPTGEITYRNPIDKSADPRIAFSNGMYYYVYTSGSLLSCYKTANVPDLGDAVGIPIWDARKASAALEGRVNNIWPSELQYFSAEEVGEENAGWYLFFSVFKADGAGDVDGTNRRSYVLKCSSDDLQGKWVNPVTGEENVPQKFTSLTDKNVNANHWCAGQSTLRYRGEVYFVWVEQRDENTESFRQIAYLSKMENPWTVSGPVLALIESEYDWEKNGHGYDSYSDLWYPSVIEGLTPIEGENGELYLLYAASGYWTPEYCLGQMTFLGGDLLKKENWKKSPDPIFSKSGEICGVGGPSLFTAGGENFILLHGYLGKDTASGRYCFMWPYKVDGRGVHIGDGSGHPQALNTEFTAPVNPLPLGDKIGGFDLCVGDFEGRPDPGTETGSAESLPGETLPGETFSGGPGGAGLKKAAPYLAAGVGILAAVGVALLLVGKSKRKKSEK